MNYLILFFIPFIFSGCLMIGKQDFSCKNTEELKDAGVCGSSMYILENKRNIEKESYKGFVKIRGTYTKCDDDECLEENEIEKKVVEKW